jgi:chemotaxis protein methyltransferase WspC
MIEEIKRIAQLIEKRSFISLDILGETNFEKLIIEKMKKLGIESPLNYYFKLVESTEAYQELLEELLVSETWFFRDPASFAFLKQFVLKELLSSHTRKHFNFLSIACSSGEEPYSIAMQMLEAGLTENQFSIDAIDVSRVSLKKAMDGVYTNNSFRGIQTENSIFMNYFEHFHGSGHLFKIKKNVQKCVKFHCGNALDETNSIYQKSYEVIFCKNVLIYMKSTAQQKLLRNLNKLLINNGVLLVAPVEVEYIKKMGYKPLAFRNSYAFQKKVATQEIPKKMSLHESVKELIKKEKPCDDLQNTNIILKAKECADSGEFDEAYNMCQKYLSENGPSASAYFLLGLIAHAKEKVKEAEDYFLKTIYLEPEHYESLIYLALLSEKKGEMNQAKLFFNRAKRINKS